MIERAIVVESNLVSRRDIARDLQTHEIAGSVLEAESVPDGLQHIQMNSFGVCVLGPALQTQTIKNFITQGRVASKSPHCAFVRLTREVNDDSELPALLDDTLVYPYDPTSLKQSITRAVESRLPNFGVQKFDVHNLRQANAPLPDTLESLAIEIRGLARALTTGQLTLNASGEPSAAALYAFRRALERAFPERNQHGDLPIDVKAFLNLALDWMKNRVTGTEGDLVQRIRKLV